MKRLEFLAALLATLVARKLPAGKPIWAIPTTQIGNHAITTNKIAANSVLTISIHGNHYDDGKLVDAIVKHVNTIRS